MSEFDKYRYQVTLLPGVAIGPDRFVRVVIVDGPDPWAAVQKAMAEIDLHHAAHLWQSDDATIRVERVA